MDRLLGNSLLEASAGIKHTVSGAGTLRSDPTPALDAADSNKQENFFYTSLLGVSWKRQLQQRRTSRERVGGKDNSIVGSAVQPEDEVSAGEMDNTRGS